MTLDLKDLIRELLRAGWRVEQRANGVGHRFAYSLDGKSIVTIGRSGDWRAMHNTLARLKRAGFKVPS